MTSPAGRIRGLLLTQEELNDAFLGAIHPFAAYELVSKQQFDKVLRGLVEWAQGMMEEVDKNPRSQFPDFQGGVDAGLYDAYNEIAGVLERALEPITEKTP